jgi:hypothetical protein
MRIKISSYDGLNYAIKVIFAEGKLQVRKNRLLPA